MIDTSIILYYIFSSIYVILFGPCMGIILSLVLRYKQIENKDDTRIRKHMVRILILICVIQCLASSMTILDQSLYLVWEYSWGYWIGHTLVVSSITYSLNLVGQILTFGMIIALLSMIAKILYKSITYEGRKTNIHLIVYRLSAVLTILYAIVSIFLFILIPYSALPTMPYVLTADVAYIMDTIGDILTAIGWGSLSLLVLFTCILNVICIFKLWIGTVRMKIIDVKGIMHRIVPLIILMDIVACIQIGSTIVGIVASFEPSLYLVSYILDKTNSLIFVGLCIAIYNPIGLLIQMIDKLPKKDMEHI